MQKIPSLFQRNYEGDRLVRDEVVPGCEWVLAGEGVATRKWDGTCCMVRNGKLYKRYELRRGNIAPEGFEPACDFDPVTNKQQGWLPVGGGPEDKWHREAFREGIEDGTYELIGPRVQGGIEGPFLSHLLVKHGINVIQDVPRTFNGIRDWLKENNHIEGIVWHHPDGRMAKIKCKGFGIKRI